MPYKWTQRNIRRCLISETCNALEVDDWEIFTVVVNPNEAETFLRDATIVARRYVAQPPRKKTFSESIDEIIAIGRKKAAAVDEIRRAGSIRL